MLFFLLGKPKYLLELQVHWKGGVATGLSAFRITVADVPNADAAGGYSLPNNVPMAAAGLVCVQVADLLSDGLSNVVCL